jgi:hypothetical protein
VARRKATEKPIFNLPPAPPEMLRRHLADPANKRPANQEKLGLGGSGNVFGNGFHGEQCRYATSSKVVSSASVWKREKRWAYCLG